MQLKINNGSFTYGGVNTILKNFDFEIKSGEKIAICGRNGSGKTTLLKLITGELELDKNINKNDSVIYREGITNIGYLKQIAFSDESLTLEQEILKVYSDIIQMKNTLDNYHSAFEKNIPTEKEISAYTALEQKFRDNNGYFYQKEYNIALQSFKFSDSDKQKKISEFSGGQKTKIAFIKLLLSKPDILIFDEPTNHLDIDSIEWLEDYLANYPKSLILVSHDRDFLDKVVNIVYEIEYGKMTRYVGNYTSFVNQKKAEYEKAVKEYKQEQNEIKKQENLIERFRYKATKASMVQSRIKALDKIERKENPIGENTRTFHFNISPDHTSGKDVLEVKNLKIGYDPLHPLATINMKVMRGDRLGIIGRNGTGKSTLLKTLAGKIPVLDGEYIFGLNAEIGYFEQQTTRYTSTLTIYEDYINEFPELTETQARNDLGSFMFSGDDVFKSLNEISGGEMVRLELLKIFKRNPNILILDEPTNHMDLIGKETLESILENYPGTLIVVSHDRYFIRKITKSVLCFEENDNVVYYPDGYDEYISKHKIIDSKKEEKIEKSKEKILTQNHITYLKNKEKSKVEKQRKNLEQQIKVIEQELTELDVLINKPEVYEVVSEFLKISTQIEEKQQQLDELYEKWLLLSDD